MVCASGQHDALVDQVAADVSLVPDIDLRVMAPDQSLTALASRVIVGVDEQVLGDRHAYEAMARAVNPYGDGHAAERIVAYLAGEPWRVWEV